MKHTTHTGEVICGDRLVAARAKVASDWEEMARSIRSEDCYASHVTLAEKEENLRADLALADRIRTGAAGGFTIWQRINTELTGECVPLLAAGSST